MSHFCVYVFHDENTSVNELLAPFDENIVYAPYVEYTKEEAIKKCRKHIEDYKNGDIYKEYLANPTEYKEKYGHNEKHIEYLEKEFPKMLNWTDEECYEYEKSWYEKDMIDENGNLMSTYNPQSKWDWYEVGGRWSGTIDGNENTIEKIGADKIDIPYAFITSDGEWIERGEMGWWGIATNEMDVEEWDKKFREYIKTLDKNLIITQVDCHI